MENINKTTGKNNKISDKILVKQVVLNQDENAMVELLNRYDNLFKKYAGIVVKKVRNGNYSYEDAYSELQLKLIEVLKTGKYTDMENTNFSVYALVCISNKAKALISKENRSVNQTYISNMSRKSVSSDDMDIEYTPVDTRDYEERYVRDMMLNSIREGLKTNLQKELLNVLATSEQSSPKNLKDFMEKFNITRRQFYIERDKIKVAFNNYLNKGEVA